MNKDKMFLDICDTISQMSKCVSFKVGSLIVIEDRIISMGYNGTPKGYINCSEIFKDYNKEIQREDHHRFSEIYECHSEINSIVWAARNGIKIDGSILYSSVQPCEQCTKNIIQSGIKKIIFRNKYDKMDQELVKQFLLDNNIEYIYEQDIKY